MKNNIFNILIFSAMSLFTMACSEGNGTPENVGGDSTIALSVQSVTFLNDGSPAEGSAASVTVESSGEWRLIGKDTWCHPSVTSGKSGETVVFAADKNEGENLRSVEFSFVCGSKTERLTVVQKKNDIIELFRSEYEVSRNGEQIVVRASANDDVSYKVSEEAAGWITLSDVPATKTLGVSIFVFDISANDEYSTRNGIIYFTAGGKTAEARITQERKIELSAEQSVYNVQGDGQRLEVKIHTNLPYSISVPEAASSWLSLEKDPQGGQDPGNITTRTEVFTISSQGEMSRAGKVTLTALGEDLTTSFTIVQRGSSPVILSIEDDKFRQALTDLSYVLPDETGSGNECELTDLGQNATTLDVSNMGISSLSGIEYFTNLTTLNCSNNNIRYLDLSQTKVWLPFSGGSQISGNPLEEIIGSPSTQYIRLENRGLTGADGTSSSKLRISGDAINGVYLQNNPNLMKLDIYHCPNIASSYISVSGCAEGSTLIVYHNLAYPPYVPPGQNIKYENTDPGDDF